MYRMQFWCGILSGDVARRLAGSHIITHNTKGCMDGGRFTFKMLAVDGGDVAMAMARFVESKGTEYRAQGVQRYLLHMLKDSIYDSHRSKRRLPRIDMTLILCRGKRGVEIG